MKKTIILTVILSFSFALSTFGKAPVLKNRADSLNYALGVVNGDGIKTYYLANDSTGKDAASLKKGIEEGMKLNPEYIEIQEIGTNIGNALKQQVESGLMGMKDIPVNIELIKQGFVNGMRGFEEQMTGTEANGYMQSTMRALEEKKMEETYGENKTAGEEFLAQNGKNADVITTASGLQYKIVKEGTGATPGAGERVKVHYHGTLIDGTVFDSSVDRGEPFEFNTAGGVIQGWLEVAQLMPVGSKWIVYIPQDLAYGPGGRGNIPPFSTLIFEIEMLSIEK